MTALQPMACRLFANLYSCEATFEETGPQSVVIWEPLDLPKVDGRPCWAFGRVRLQYDEGTDRRVVEVIVHDGRQGFGEPLCFMLSNGLWYEVNQRSIVRLADGSWAVRWAGAKNTRTARWLNAAAVEETLRPNPGGP